MSQTFDENGYQYIIAHSDSGKHWTLVKHRFQITHSTKQIAQFITSNWFATLIDPNLSKHFLLIGIKGHFKYSEIQYAINRNPIDSGLTEEEKQLNIKYKDKFHLESSDIKKYIEHCKSIKDSSFDIKLPSKIYQTNLIFRGRSVENSLYLTLPEFIINSVSHFEK